MADQTPLIRPIPRRAFELTPVSTESSQPATPSSETADPNYLDAKANGNAPSRTRSILNLTSSTLFGIYSRNSSDAPREEVSTPWGTGAQTPVQRHSIDEQAPLIGSRVQRPRPKITASHIHPGHHNIFLALALRTILLFASGMAYGVVVTHLHDDQRLAPVKMSSINRESWAYLIFWGIAGVGLGSLLPWVDFLWEETLGTVEEVGIIESLKDDTRSSGTSGDEDERPSSWAGSGLGADWTPVVRSIGAFIGIAFAIRKLPWQSTLQVSLTLALANPVLWYLIDRSKPGFLLSTIVGLAGTAVMLGVNPEMVPPPATPSPRVSAGNVSNDVGFEGRITKETIGVGTWIASVLFCSCVCFGNIGRRLALSRTGKGSINS